jgi:hypothetical protein
MTQLEQGVELWGKAAEMLNSVIKRHGKIEANNKEIWQTFLHQWSNEEWELVIVSVAILYDAYPNYFKRFHIDALKQAGSTLLKYKDTTDMVLDKKQHKSIEWRMLMTLRELWNACRDDYVPNDNSARKLNEFRNLFNT